MTTAVVGSPFGTWVSQRREALGLSQASLARVVAKHLKSDYTRDNVWQLENGKPKNPTPDVVQAVAKALERPLVEALGRLGYEFPASSVTSAVHPALAKAVGGLPLGVQERLAEVLPGIVSIGEYAARGTGKPSRVPTAVDATADTRENPASAAGPTGPELQEPNHGSAGQAGGVEGTRDRPPRRFVDGTRKAGGTPADMGGPAGPC